MLNIKVTRRTMLGQTSAAGTAAWLGSARTAAADRSAVNFDVPRGACDCHVHVFGDTAKFPFAAAAGLYAAAGLGRGVAAASTRSAHGAGRGGDAERLRHRQFLHARRREADGRARSRHRGDRQVDAARGVAGDGGGRRARHPAQSLERRQFRSEFGQAATRRRGRAASRAQLACADVCRVEHHLDAQGLLHAVSLSGGVRSLRPAEGAARRRPAGLRQPARTGQDPATPT